MGSSQSSTNNVTLEGGEATPKRVVMIGFSYGGQQIVKHMHKMDTKKVCHFTVVDKSDHFEHQPNQFEAFTDPEVFTKTNCLMFDIMTKTHEKMTGGRFTFKRGKLTHVLHKENQIEITSPDGVSTEIIDYDVLCISTGANYCNPWRPDDTLCDTLVDRDEEFAQCRKEMKETPSILCIGAGETGLETAGWMKEHYPDKVIGVAMRGNTILRGIDGAHKVAEKHLKEMDINIHYNTTHTDGATLKYNETDSYAYYLDCTGLKFNGPTEFFKTQMDVLDKKTNQILVDKEGRVTNVHPIADILKNDKTPLTLNNVFCIGDVCLTPSNETKSVVSMYQYTPVVAHNMLQVLLGLKCDWQIPKEFSNLQMVPIGSKRGIQIFNNFIKEDSTCWQFKLDIRDMQIGSLSGDKKQEKAAANNAFMMPKIFSLASSKYTTCLPIHISKSRNANQEFLQKSKKEYDSIYNQ